MVTLEEQGKFLRELWTSSVMSTWMRTYLLVGFCNLQVSTIT